MRSGFIAVIIVFTFASAGVAQGTIEGVVKFSGAAPANPPFVVTRDQNYCGQHKPNETVLVSKSSGLANAVISVEGAPKGNAKPGEVVVANEQCRFNPHVTAAMAGSTLVVQSRDSIMHNTHVYMSDGATFFNIAFPFKGGQIKRPLVKPDMLNFKCDVGHTWMSAYVLVFANPFFAISDADGNFRIEAVPPGQYTLKAWHEKLGTQTQKITIPAGVTKAEFTYKDVSQ